MIIVSLYFFETSGKKTLFLFFNQVQPDWFRIFKGFLKKLYFWSENIEDPSHKNRNMKNLASNILIIICMSAFMASCRDSDKNEELPKASYDMELENSKGERVSMEEFKGKVIFMNVWATWCAPCIEEMPTIQNLYKGVEKERYRFIMLSMDQDFEKAIEFRNKNAYDFEIYRLLGPMPAIYHTKLIPTTFVIDSAGNLVLQHDGMGKFDSPQFKQFLAGVE